MSKKNTLQKGRVRFLIFYDKEAKSWFGVALEFNIVEEGDNRIEVMASLFQAIQGYVKAAQKIKMRPSVLNQKSDKEYENLWNEMNNNKQVDSDKFSVTNFGYQNLRMPVGV